MGTQSTWGRRRWAGSFRSGRRRRCACVLDTSINIAAVIRTIGSLINKVLNFLSAPFRPLINQVEKVIDNIMDKAINALERKFNQHFNLDKLLVFPVIIKGLKKKAEDQIQSIKDALPMQQMKALFEDSTKKSIPSRYLTTAAKNAAKNGAKQSTPTNNQRRRRSNNQQSNNQQSPSRCWKVMPSGCANTLSETSTPKTWFIDPHSPTQAKCSQRTAAFNAYCRKSDVKSAWQVNQPAAASLDAKLVGGYPYLKWTDGKYHPICGHCFWDKKRGADLFCKRA